jgi:hypothetical protein
MPENLTWDQRAGYVTNSPTGVNSDTLIGSVVSMHFWRSRFCDGRSTVLATPETLPCTSMSYASAKNYSSHFVGSSLGKLLLRLREPHRVCRKCAVRCDPVCAKALLFNTRPECFRAGLFWR